ncbi:MAG: 50S ribosomal protein L25 [Anaerolineales bacterium]|jgi:large subunit ribosomal protein L25|uniref:50S ribosomal protein L25 n=1 Tax=Candidatus Villigracilis affinis TaxID=3140682 RepID=UPI001D8F31C2|nr:50S ribosomal protein L25 [Anaerolineales bacterium]MBK9603230.1 50S ribosomal protein L25 [Anaerolineales bacterium]MBL0346388.1 50S ribosomal protein L25 [Anaerolineales bacterium]
MEKVVLKASKREVTGKQVKALRRDGQLPAVIYGRHVEPIAISLEAHSTGLVFAKLTSSTLVTIDVDGTEYAALVREKQRNYIKGNLTHIDFLAVDLTEKITTKVHLTFTGVSSAVKDYSAVLVHRMEQLEVECLPTDLPERILVDISTIKEIGNSIRVRDIALPENVAVLEDADEIVIIATLAKEEVAEEGAVVPGVEAAAPGLSVERGKKDEEGAEKK